MHSLLLQHISKFVSLDDRETTMLCTAFAERRLKKKQYLHNIGDVMRHENFITKGCLKAYYIDEKGEEHIVQFGVENWWIGDMYSFLTQTPSIYNIEALEDCTLLQIDKETLDKLFLEVPKIERYFRLLIQNAYVASSKRVL